MLEKILDVVMFLIIFGTLVAGLVLFGAFMTMFVKFIILL